MYAKYYLLTVRLCVFHWFYVLLRAPQKKRFHSILSENIIILLTAGGYNSVREEVALEAVDIESPYKRFLPK